MWRFTVLAAVFDHEDALIAWLKISVIKTQKSLGSLLLGWGLEDSRRPVASPSPCVPFPCVHICVGKLECYCQEPGEVHGETLLPGWMAQTIQRSTGRMLVAPAELHVGLETFLRNTSGLLWKLFLLVLCWGELMLLKTRIKWSDAVLMWGRERSQPELSF